jgi:hypothetical protein
MTYQSDRIPDHSDAPSRVMIEPYRIFFLRKRAEIAQQNPGLSNSELTSLLGRLWRAMGTSEKQEYLHLAVNVGQKSRDARRRRRPPSRRMTTSLDPAETANPPDMSPHELQSPVADVAFCIIPRQSSGTVAADVSHTIVFSNQRPFD